jgi:hypothetical protein
VPFRDAPATVALFEGGREGRTLFVEGDHLVKNAGFRFRSATPWANPSDGRPGGCFGASLRLTSGPQQYLTVRLPTL